MKGAQRIMNFIIRLKILQPAICMGKESKPLSRASEPASVVWKTLTYLTPPGQYFIGAKSSIEIPEMQIIFATIACHQRLHIALHRNT